LTFTCESRSRIFLRRPVPYIPPPPLPPPHAHLPLSKVAAVVQPPALSPPGENRCNICSRLVFDPATPPSTTPFPFHPLPSLPSPGPWGRLPDLPGHGPQPLRPRPTPAGRRPPRPATRRPTLHPITRSLFIPARYSSPPPNTPQWQPARSFPPPGNKRFLGPAWVPVCDAIHPEE